MSYAHSFSDCWKLRCHWMNVPTCCNIIDHLIKIWGSSFTAITASHSNVLCKLLLFQFLPLIYLPSSVFFWPLCGLSSLTSIWFSLSSSFCWFLGTGIRCSPRMHAVNVTGRQSLNCQIKFIRPSQGEGNGAEPEDEAGRQYRWKSPIFCHWWRSNSLQTVESAVGWDSKLQHSPSLGEVERLSLLRQR